MKNLKFTLRKLGIACLIAAAFLLSALKLYSQEGGYWEEVAQMPSSRFLLSAEKVGGLIYIMGGIVESFSTTNGVYAFNPADNTFQQRKPLPKSLAAMATAVYEDTLYVFGGIPWSQGPPSQKCYKYIPSLNEWFELPDLPSIPRGYAVAEVLGDKIYLIGGLSENSTTTYNLVEVFDPVAGIWSTEPIAQMPTPRGYMCSAVLNGRIYVFGGGTPAPYYAGLPTVEYFDGVSWATADTMPTHRYGAGAGVIGDAIIYVSGGVLSGYSNVNVTEGYSEATGWRTFAPLPVVMHGHAEVAFGNVLYAFGGVGGDASAAILYKKVFVYHPPVINSTDNPINVQDLSVFPNPASDQLTIINHNASDGCLTLVQTDGRVVAKLRLQGQSQMRVSVADVPPGLLLWKWVPGCTGVVQTGRVLVVR